MNPTRSTHAWERHECKFLVPEAMAARLEACARPFTEPDANARGRPDHTYPISSLYLDAEDLCLYRETVDGKRNRFKLRIRTYSDDASLPVYAEIKRRVGAVVQKQRSPMPRHWLAAVAAGERCELPQPGKGQQSLDTFVRLVQSSRAKPQVMVRYDRQAYVGIGDPETRITFDRNLAVLRTGRAELRVHDERFQRLNQRSVILELKFSGRCPGWMLDLVRRFELKRTSFSKYCRSVDGATSRAFDLDPAL